MNVSTVDRPDGLAMPAGWFRRRGAGARREASSPVERKGDRRAYLGNHGFIPSFVRAILFVESLPKTATGKIQRFKLPQFAAASMWLHTK